jgi:outer membrane protein TolC
MKKRLMVFFSIMGIGLQPVVAQQSPLRMTLSEALDIARRQQPDFRNAERNIAYARSLTQSAKATYLPKLVAESDIRYNAIIPTSVLPGNALNPAGDPKELVPLRFGTPWNNSLGVRLTQPLYDPVKLATLQGSMLGEKQAEAEQRRLAADRYVEIAGAWYALLLSRSRVGTIRKDLERNQENARLIESMLAEGRCLEVDLREAALRTRSSKIDLEQVALEIFTAQGNISYLLGYDTLVLIEPKESLMDMPMGGINPDGIERLGSGLENPMPEVEVEKVRAAISNLELSRVKAERLPVVNLEGYLGSSNFTNRFQPFTNWYGNSFLGLSLRWPIYDGGEKKKQMDQAAIRLEQQVNTVRKTEQKVYFDRLQARNDLKNRQAMMIVQQEKVGVAMERVEIIRSRLQEGRATVKELLDVEALLAKEQDILYRAQYDLLRAVLASDKSNGSLVPRGG